MTVSAVEAITGTLADEQSLVRPVRRPIGLRSPRRRRATPADTKTVTIRIRRHADEARDELAGRCSQPRKSGKADGDLPHGE
jgi:hypothetical protein